MPDDSLREALKYLEEELDLGAGFLVSLWAEKDAWSFVIKAHALLETALSQLLGSYLLDRRLDQVVHLLALGGRAGRVAFLKAMGLLTEVEESFIKEFSGLRNSLVHNIHNTRFDFQTFLVVDAERAGRLAKCTAAFGGSEAVRTRYDQDFEKEPQHRLWLAVLAVVAKAESTLLKSEEKRRNLERGIRLLHDL